MSTVLSLTLACWPLSGRADDEEAVGRLAAAQILGAAPLVAPDAVQQYVNLVAASIAPYCAAAYKWRIGVVRSDAVNAFATPGGFVLLTSGLARLLDSEDELAFVISHEMSHVVRRHHYQVVQRQRMAEQATKSLQSMGQEADTARLSQASGQIYARGLDKAAEFEADRLGAEALARAGYDPAAALGVLDKLQRFKGDDPRTELLFATHPTPASRIDLLLQAGLDRVPRPKGLANEGRAARFRAFQKAL